MKYSTMNIPVLLLLGFAAFAQSSKDFPARVFKANEKLSGDGWTAIVVQPAALAGGTTTELALHVTRTDVDFAVVTFGFERECPTELHCDGGKLLGFEDATSPLVRGIDTIVGPRRVIPLDKVRFIKVQLLKQREDATFR